MAYDKSDYRKGEREAELKIKTLSMLEKIINTMPDKEVQNALRDKTLETKFRSILLNTKNKVK